MSTRRLGYVSLGVILLLTVIWYGALFRPQSARLKAEHRDYAAAEVKLEQLRTQAASLQALEKQVPADRQRLTALDSEVPTTPDLKDVLGELHDSASTSGVQLQSVSPSNPPTSTGASQSTSGPAAIQLTMTAAGSYSQLMDFVTHLTQMARAVAVNNLSLSAGNSGAVTANLTANIFYAP
jgi:Tfp pilus assembly protein PilO